MESNKELPIKKKRYLFSPGPWVKQLRDEKPYQDSPSEH
jgi:hypothetical protein